MNKDELTPKLRQQYQQKLGCGIAKVDDKGYENIWFVVPPAPPITAPDNLPITSIAAANAVLSRLPDFETMDSTDRLINYFFTRREALQSSRIEGTWSTIDNVLTPTEIYESSTGKSENKSVRGYAQALENFYQNASSDKEGALSLKLVKQLHREIVSKDPNFTGIAGELRKPGMPGGVVQIGGGYRKENSTYNPAPPRHVERCLKETLAWLQDEGLAQKGDAGLVGFTLIVRLAIGHAHFEAVHPFSDGNGRVGRALWPLQMIASTRMPLYLSGYVETHKSDYSLALQDAQKKLDYYAIVEFLCQAVQESDREAKITRAAIETLPSQWKARAKFRAVSAAEKALTVIQRTPIFTAAILTEELKTSKQAISTALKQLTERGVIRNRGRVGRTMCYAAEELISLLGRNFGDDADAALESGRRAMLPKNRPA